jgi:ATP-dependent Lon protease
LSSEIEVPVDSIEEIEDLLESLPLEEESGDSESRRPDVPEILNLLPLRESVIYPMLIAPLSVSRSSAMQLIDDSVAESTRVIGAISQRQPQTDEPTFDDIFEYGCAVIIRTLMKTGEGTRMIVQGVSRFKIVERLQDAPYLKARVEVIEEPEVPADQAEEIEALRRTVASLFDQAVALHPNLPDELQSLTSAVQEPGVFADLVAAHIPMATAEKQEILEILPIRERLRKLVEFLGREVRVLELTNRVQSEVSAELSKSQRDYYLREQLKAIQRELGMGDDTDEDLAEFRIKIDESGMSAHALREANREYDRLRRINPGSPEYTVARTYLETMLALPWRAETPDNLDLVHARGVLDDEHYGLDKIKRRIVEFLAVRKVKTDGPVRQPILCFAGPPGVGKTSLGRSIAHALGREFVRISLGGMRDEAEIRGHRRTYIGSMPGQIIQGLRRAGTRNPVFVLDEIDKLGTDFRGDPASALLEVLDPQQNDTFRDHYVDAPFDLSNVFFVTTANRLDTIPAALRDRMEIIELGGYTEEEKVEIAKRHLVPRQISEHGLTTAKLKFDDAALVELVRHYTREAGVRNLEREVASVIRKATVLFAEGRTAPVKVTRKFVREALGAPRYLEDAINERSLKPGMAIGLAWTPVGGDVLFIETARMPGQKGLTVTGQLGDVMKESVQLALTYLRAHHQALKISPTFFDESDLHVHVPEGAVPKDGPSAGITMLTALASLLSGRVVRPRLAMTGEVTLTGQVLAVGGIKEKVLAAHRAGVQTLILPKENRKDYDEEVPEAIRQQLTAHFVSSAEEVLRLALSKGSTIAPSQSS